MSETTGTETTGTNGTTEPVVRKRRQMGPRKSSQAKPIYLICQVLGDDGSPVEFDKRRLRILSVDRDSEKVLEMIDGGTEQNAFYVRTMLPPLR